MWKCALTVVLTSALVLLEVSEVSERVVLLNTVCRFINSVLRFVLSVP